MPSCRDSAAATKRARMLSEVAGRLYRSSVDVDAAVRVLDQLAHAASPVAVSAALALASELAGNEVRPKGAPKVPTFRKLAERWTSGELAERYPDQVRVKRSAKDDMSRLDNYVLPLIGPIPIDRITLDDCEGVMRQLPPTLSVATRRNVGQLVTRLLRLAVYPCRYIDRSPVPTGFLPRGAAPKALAYLYPDEDRRLLAYTEIPLRWRLLWGILAREGMRLGEAIALTWGDFDLERGAVRLDVNKTDDPRAWALGPGVAAALSVYRPDDVDPRSRVFMDDAGRPLRKWSLAELLRSHLAIIGLKEERPELFTTTEQRRRIRVHDLRGTFVTVALANGRSEAWIADRTGHRSSTMINRYKRTARTFTELNVGELTPLDVALPEVALRAGGASTPESNGGAGMANDWPTAVATACDHDSLGEESPDRVVIPDGYATVLPDSNPVGVTIESASENAQLAITPLARGPIVGHSVSGETDVKRPVDPVEAALADALQRAAAVGQWQTVEVLARELQARREARAGVVELDAERAKRGR